MLLMSPFLMSLSKFNAEEFTMTESPSHRVVVVGPDGQPVGFADVPNSAGGTSSVGSDGADGGGAAARRVRSIRPTPSASPPR